MVSLFKRRMRCIETQITATQEKSTAALDQINNIIQFFLINTSILFSSLISSLQEVLFEILRILLESKA